MKTSTGNQEQCLNPSAAVSLLHAHTSPIIPRKREAQTTQLHHLSPASPGAPLPCLHAQPSLLQGYFGTKPPPHAAASRQQMSPLGAVWVCVPSPKPPRQCYSKPWHPTICFLLLQSMISAPGWEIQSCCCLSWRDSRTRQNINGERQSCSKRQSRGWNPYPPGQPHILLQDHTSYYKTTGEACWGTPASAGFNGFKKSHQQCESSAAARAASPGSTPAEGMLKCATSTARGGQTTCTRPAGEHPCGHCRTPGRTAASPLAEGRKEGRKGLLLLISCLHLPLHPSLYAPNWCGS